MGGLGHLHDHVTLHVGAACRGWCAGGGGSAAAAGSEGGRQCTVQRPAEDHAVLCQAGPPDAPARCVPYSPWCRQANRITKPLLLIHGEDDNNTGTFPMQSERLYQVGVGDVPGLGYARV